LQLPDIEDLRQQINCFDAKADFQNYSVELGKLDNRLDGSYHIPIVSVIHEHLKNKAQEFIEVIPIGDSKISKKIILPGRFKRIYVEEGNGVVFFGGKQIHEIDPSSKKYLSLQHHGKRIMDELAIHKNFILITRSGTIGKVTMVPEHWDNWIPNEHIIRVIPSSDEIAGYLYAWLSSSYAYPLITRFTYGAVVDEIDDKQVSQILVPLLKDYKNQKEINDKILEANQKRAEAYYTEQKALKILDEQVIYAQT